MLSKNSKGFFILSTIITGFIAAFDLAVIVILLEATPVMEGYALSEALIFVKFIIFFTLFIMQLIFLLRPHSALNKHKLNMLLITAFSVTITYVIAMYVNKFTLIVDVAAILRNHIITGNPSLALSYSIMGYQKLLYIIVLYFGVASELILFIQILLLIYLIYKARRLETLIEETHTYDHFVFERRFYYFALPMTILMVMSLDIFTFQYDLSGIIGMGFGMTGIFMLIPVWNAIYSIHNAYENQTKSFVRSHYQSIIIYCSIIFASLIGMGIIILFFEPVGEMSYKAYLVLSASVISLLILTLAAIKLNLENKQ